MFKLLQRLCGSSAISGIKAGKKKSGRSKSKRSFQPRIESLEGRELMTANNLVLYNASTITTFADVGFYNNPVASLDAYYNGKQDRDPSHFRAMINWGDGTGWQTGQIGKNETTGAKIPFVIKGSHVYQDANTYKIQVTVQGDGMTLTKQECAAAVINMPASQEGSKPEKLGGSKPLGNTTLVLYNAAALSVVQGQTLDGTVAFADGSYNGPKDKSPSDYKVQINWGDSSDWQLGQVQANSTPGSRIPLELKGSHVYTTPGTYKVVVQLTGPDGQTLSKKTVAVQVKPDPNAPAPVVFKLTAAVNESQVQAMQLAQKMDLWADKVESAVMDALKSFARGLATTAKPDPISLFNPADNPFSRSFFDAGRMLRGMAQGTYELPGELAKMARNIIDHPQVLIPGYPLYAAAAAIGNGLKDPAGTATALYKGFEAFRDMDPALAGGKSIPGRVLTSMFGPDNPLKGKITKANKVFAIKGGNQPVPNYQGVSPDLIPPKQVVPGGVKPLSAVINEIRWANNIAKVNPGFGRVVGRDTNCPYAALVTDKILAGHSLQDITDGLMLRTAPPSGLKSAGWVESFFPGREFSDMLKGPALVNEMRQAGNGGRGIVFGLKFHLDAHGNEVFEEGHFFNVVNNNGVITFYDGQSGGLANMDEFHGFSLLRTH